MDVRDWPLSSQPTPSQLVHFKKRRGGQSSRPKSSTFDATGPFCTSRIETGRQKGTGKCRRRHLRRSRSWASGISERPACRLVDQPRGTQRYQPLRRIDEDPLTQAILTLASEYGRYGYRRVTKLLRDAGWPMGKDRVQRIWRREGLKVSAKQTPLGRLWLNDGSCIRLRRSIAITSGVTISSRRAHTMDGRIRFRSQDHARLVRRSCAAK